MGEWLAITVLLLLAALMADCYTIRLWGGGALASSCGVHSTTALHSHRPQMKTIKRTMHRRPKKHRPSDINRNNVNLNKCITKIEGAPPEYTICSEEEFEAALSFWEDGDPDAEWLPLVEAEDPPPLSTNLEPLAPGTRTTLRELKRTRANI